jgi:pimeloyl-ACP methyl ester carboxylesterase
VAGLVLVDSTHERVFQLCSELSDDPDFWQKVRGRFERDAESIGGGTAAEFEELWKIFRRGTLPEAEPLPDVPMIVLTAYEPDPSWVCTSEPSLKNLRRLHAEYFERTTLGAHIVTPGSGHRIHADQPGLVVESIRQIVELLR